MSRFTASILMATALLGVLLWIILSMVRDFARGPAEPVAGNSAPIFIDPALPRLDDSRALRAWLDSIGAGATRLDAYNDWLHTRGYPSMPPFIPTSETDGLYLELDNAKLLVLAGQGDIVALQLLAERSLADDPLAALEWYDQAVVNGSLYAMLRLAELLDTYADPALEQLSGDSAFGDELRRIRAADPPPRERALAWAVALLTAGGHGVADTRLADTVRRLVGELDQAALGRACMAAQDYVLEAAATRRAQGDAVFSLARPALALSVADSAQLNPCSLRMLSLISYDSCAAENFVAPGPVQMTAWICP